jgi:hypothetical protein
MVAWEGGHDTNGAGALVSYAYARGHDAGLVEVDKQTPSTLLALDEGQASYVLVALHHGNGEESPLASESIFHGPREDLEGWSDTDDGAEGDEVGEADGTEADAESADDVEEPGIDGHYLEAGRR